MSEQHSGRHLPDAPTSGSSLKPEAHLRLVGADGRVVIPENAEPSDNSPTIISKRGPKSLVQSMAKGENLIGKNLRGQKLAHFELLEPIGVGGMAAVMRAKDLQLDRFVALKILPPEMAEDEENIRRFHQEARAAARLDHPNIAQVFFCGEDRNLNFIAFEFVEGDNLRTILEKRGRLPVAEAVRYVIQVAVGLDHAASRGVVHRDIKPSNIIITPTGAAKLVDMGLARSLSPHADDGLTQSGMTLGTFDYISPEQALEPREADVRSDIYSLGCTFYHMLTGQPPVPEGTAAKKLYHHQHLAPVDPRQLNPEIPDEVAAILMRMMSKDPGKRYQKPVQLVQHLMQVAQKVGAGAEIPEGSIFLDAPLPGAPRFRPLLTVSLAALALGILLMLLSLAPKPTSIPAHPAPKNNRNVVKEQPVRDGTEEPPVPPLPPNKAGEITSPKQLENALKQGNQTVSLGSDITLENTGLKFEYQGKSNLVVQPFPTRKRTRISFKFQKSDSPRNTACLSMLTAAGCTVTFKDIDFEYEAKGLTAPEAMLELIGPGFNLERCTFKQKGNLEAKDLLEPLASVRVVSSGDKALGAPQLVCTDCLWWQGQAAVAFQGPANVDVANCGFGPHNALFHMSGKSKTIESQLNLMHCSAFVRGSVFRLDGSYGCKLNVDFCLFSCPDDLLEGSRAEAKFINQTESRDKGLLSFKGEKNCFHNFTGLWYLPGVQGNMNIDDFRADFRALSAKDIDFFVLPSKSNPWLSKEPLFYLEKEEDPARAFRIQPKMEELRIAKNSAEAVGLKHCYWGPMEQLPLLIVAKAPEVNPLGPNAKVIDPDAINPPRGTYRTLAEALSEAAKGDVLYIKHSINSRVVPVEGLAIDESGAQSLKFMPYPQYRPILKFSDKPGATSLFSQNANGKAHFENLEFALDHEIEAEHKSDFQTMFFIPGGGKWSFHRCVFTMKRPVRGLNANPVQMSVVTIGQRNDDSGIPGMPKMPKMPMQDAPPSVTFTDCVVRGEGTLLNVLRSRPLDLTIGNSMLALSGSLLTITGSDKDWTSPEGRTAFVKMKMHKVSAFFGEPLVCLKASNKVDGSLSISYECTNNLFVLLSDKKQPFLAIEGDVANQYPDWKGQNNAYVNLESMLEVKRPDAFAGNVLLEKAGWSNNGDRDQEPFFPEAAFKMNTSTPLWGVTLDDFKPLPESEARLPQSKYGATLDATMLPPLASPRKLDAAP